MTSTEFQPSTFLSNMGKARNMALVGGERKWLNSKSESYTNEKWNHGKLHTHQKNYGPVACWRYLQNLVGNISGRFIVEQLLPNDFANMLAQFFKQFFAAWKARSFDGTSLARAWVGTTCPSSELKQKWWRHWFGSRDVAIPDSILDYRIPRAWHITWFVMLAKSQQAKLPTDFKTNCHHSFAAHVFLL